MARLPNKIARWKAWVGLGPAICFCQQPPQPGFPGGGLWKAPPNRMVPIQIVEGLVIARGTISGTGKASGPLPFVVDTAATSTVVDAARAQQLGWRTETRATYPGRTVELAGASIANTPIFGLPLTGLARQAGIPVEAVAGSDIFQHFAVRLNYVDQWIMLQVPESCATPEKKLHVRMAGGLPFVEAMVTAPGGQAVQGLFLVDSGQPGAGLILTSQFLAKHAEFKEKTAQLPAFDAAGTVQRTEFLRVATLQLGDYPLHSVVATVAAPSAGHSELAGVIGAGVLSRFDLIVDLPRHSLALTPNARFSDPFEADMSGVLLLNGDADGRSGQSSGRLGGHAYMVAGIAEKSPASEAGLQAGDRLVAIADRDTRDMTMEMIRGILKSGPGTRVMVGIDRSGKKLQVVLTLRRAI